MAQPLSPDAEVLDDGGFYEANIGRLGYRVRVSHTSLERAIVAKQTGGNYPSIMRDMVVCQCDGTAKKVDACLMGMRIRKSRMDSLGANGPRTLNLPTASDIRRSANDTFTSIRAECNEQADDTLMDYQGA